MILNSQIERVLTNLCGSVETREFRASMGGKVQKASSLGGLVTQCFIGGTRVDKHGHHNIQNRRCLKVGVFSAPEH